MKDNHKFFVINPGATSTKVAVFENDREIFSQNIQHNAEELAKFDQVYDQFDYRLGMIRDVIAANHIDLSEFSAMIARGGNMKPVVGGTYKVNDEMLADMKIGYMGQHPNNTGGGMAKVLADEVGIDAYVVDPVTIDEFDPLARISGTPLIKRKSKFHALNQKAVAREAAKKLGKQYSDINCIVAHMGGGITVGAHMKGKVIDVNNGLNGDGPMSPERAGGMPFSSIVDLCYSGEYTKDEIMKQFVGKGGLVAYLGTNDGREVVKRINEGDEEARLYYEAMAYQIAKEIGSAATVLKGDIDCICFTGGLAYDDLLMSWIKERVAFIAPVLEFPGEHEMVALAKGVLRVLNGDEDARTYPVPGMK